MTKGMVAALAAVLISCASIPSSRQIEASLASLSAQIRAKWESHRAVIVEVLHGHEYSGDQFEASVSFFERITHISSHVRVTFVGLIPGPNLSSDLSAWDEWLTKNTDCLYWDQQIQDVGCHWVVD